MKDLRWVTRFAALAFGAGLLCSLLALAQNTSGHGGGPTASRFSVVELPIRGRPYLSNAGPDGVVTVAIDSDEAGYVSAAYAYVNRADGQVLESAHLPEPPFVDPNDGVMKNGPSGPADVNDFGDIVGFASTFDPEAPSDNPSPGRAILWTDDGSGYAYTLLPLLPGSTASGAYGNNNRGHIVGWNGGGESPHATAVLWDAETHAATDLNTEATAAQGWELLNASDINDDGLIVGVGLLDGVFQGYLLDLATETVWAVPLIGPAVSNFAARINASGRVVGSAFDGEGRHFGANPDYFQAYSWDGPLTEAVALPSVTDNTCDATGLNDGNAVVGHSYIRTDATLGTIYSVPTLWEHAENGEVVTTELQSAIPKRPYTLVWCTNVNNDLWIGVQARKFFKGQYSSPAVILIPNK